MSSQIMNGSIPSSIRIGSRNQSQRLRASTTVRILLSFLKERERTGCSCSSSIALAAFNFRRAIWIFADQLAFWFRAIWFVTFPVTLGLFTDGLALRLRCLAMCHAMWSFADCYTFWAVKHLASFVWALDFTFRLLAFHVADGVLRLSA